MREIISLHIGQAGVQVADPYWRLLCSEHNIDVDGIPFRYKTRYIRCGGDMCSESIEKCEEAGNYYRVFQESPKGRYCSRSVLIDPDPDTIDRFKRCYDHGLHNRARYITSYDSCSNLFAKGKFAMFSETRPKILEAIRRSLEECDSPEGFFTICSLGGGTGSGLTVALLNYLQNSYNKMAQVQLTVFPTPQASIVEPYNCGLHKFIMCNYERALLLVDNDAINYAMTLMRRPTKGFDSVNGMIAQLASCMTAGIRFEEYSQGKIGLRELQCSLTPTSCIKYSSVGYSPMSSNWAAKFDKLDEIRLTGDCFSNNNQLITCRKMGMKPNLGTCMIYRGDIDLFKAKQCVADCIRKVPSIGPTGFSICVNKINPHLLKESGITKTKNSACRFSTNLGLKSLWKNTYENYKKMLDKRAFVHWFEKEGISYGTMKEAEESLCCLIDEYNFMLGK